MAKLRGFFSDEELSSVGINGPNSGECEKCGLSKTCKTPQMGYTGKGEKGILIVAEAPSEADDKAGTPLSGDTGKWFKEKLKTMGIDLERDCWKTNAVGCHTAKVTKAHVKHCSSRLKRTITELKPRFIWLMGTDAIYSYYHERESVTTAERWRGLRIPDVERQAWVFPLYHPAYVIRMEKDDHFQNTFGRDLSHAIRMSKGDDKPEAMSLKGAKIIKDFDEVMNALEKVLDDKPEFFAFDYETTGLKPYRKGHRIASMSFCTDYDTSYGLPYQYRNHFNSGQIDQIGDVWAEILTDKAIKKVAHNCFTGDTAYITIDGIKTLKETVGTIQTIWTSEGWKQATVKMYGVADITQITVGPSHRSMSNIKHTILCTENHRWLIDRYKTSQYTTKPNSSFWVRHDNVLSCRLKKKDRIVGELPVFKLDENSDAFRHGLIFADGCRNGKNSFQIRLCGDKSRYKDCFEKFTYPPSAKGDPVVNWYKSSIDCKDVPKNKDANYIANFIEAWQQMDGTDATNGDSRIITTVNEKAAIWLKDNAAIGGWYCTGFSEHTQHPNQFQKETKQYWMVVITKDKTLGWTIKDIKHNVAKEVVYCLEVPELEKFTLAHGIYTANSKFEDMWSREFFGIDINPMHWCSMNAAHILDNRSEFSGLKYQALIRWGIPDYDSSIEKYLKNESKDTPYNRVMEAPLNDLLLYNSIDSLLTYRLQAEQEEELSDRPKMESARKFFMGGLKTLATLQENGIPLNRKYYVDMNVELEQRISTMKEALHNFPEAQQFLKERRRPINFKSSADLADLFFNVLKLPKGKLTAGGNACVDAEVLASLNTPIAKEKTKISKLEKIKGTYLGQFLREIEDDNKLHPFFDLHTVATYRGSSSSPNFQNIPVRDAEAMNITRGGIVPSFGNQLVDWDYGSMEVRIIACITQDPVLIKYIEDPTSDMHRDQAMDWFSFTKEEWAAIDKKEAKNIRFVAKNSMVFALFYGSYYRSIARGIFPQLKEMKVGEINIYEHLRRKGVIKSMSTAQEDFENHTKRTEQRFWNRFKAVKTWQEKAFKSYLEKGYIEQMFGFRCHGWLTRNDICNYPVQGTAFHCLIWAINKLEQRMLDERMKSMLIGQIHDCCLADINPTEHMSWCNMSRLIATKEIREEHPWIIVPLDIEFERSEIDEPWSKKREFHHL